MNSAITLANTAILLADLKPVIIDDSITIPVVTRYGKATLELAIDDSLGWWVFTCNLPDGAEIFRGEYFDIEFDQPPHEAARRIRELVTRITGKPKRKPVNPITRTNGTASWMAKAGDSFVVTGTRTDGKRFTIHTKHWWHARGINVWHGSKWLLRDGRKWLIQRITN